MHTQRITTEIKRYELSELPKEDQQLLTAAATAAEKAYAPYSHYPVGAALMLDNGQTLSGSNQENAAFPVGICAERVTLSAKNSQQPDAQINTLAIVVRSEASAPCGVCRQTLLEQEYRQQQPIRLLLKGKSDEVLELDSVQQLMPLPFLPGSLEH